MIDVASRATSGHYALVVNPEVRILGVHPVDGVDGCFLIESIITGATAQPDFGQMTQLREDRDHSNWQVAYDEKLLDDDGELVVADLYLTRVAHWPNRARVAFFFHDLDPDRTLSTPFGNSAIPSPTPRPARLAMLVYEAP